MVVVVNGGEMSFPYESAMLMVMEEKEEAALTALCGGKCVKVLSGSMESLKDTVEQMAKGYANGGIIYHINEVSEKAEKRGLK